MYAFCIEPALAFGNALYLATRRPAPSEAPRRAAKSVFAELGGAAAMGSFVTRLHERLLADHRVAEFFANSDLPSLTRFHSRFLAWVFGGDPNYPGWRLAAAHASLAAETGFGDEHFDALIDDLAATLSEFGINDNGIDRIRLIAEGIRAEIHGLAAT